MPQNGAAVNLPLARDPQAQSAKAVASPLGCASEEIVRRIGEAAASAAVAIAMGMADFAAAAQISPDIKTLAGWALAEVAELQLDYVGDDSAFAALARRQGRKVLELRYGAMLRAHLGTAKVDTAFDDLLSHVLHIANKVTAVERTLAH